MNEVCDATTLPAGLSIAPATNTPQSITKFSGDEARELLVGEPTASNLTISPARSDQGPADWFLDHVNPAELERELAMLATLPTAPLPVPSISPRQILQDFAPVPPLPVASISPTLILPDIAPTVTIPPEIEPYIVAQEDESKIHPTAAYMASFRCLRLRIQHPAQLHIVEQFCTSPDFLAILHHEGGLPGATFKLNTSQSEELQTKFWSAPCLHNATLAVVFHGTHTSNIDTIKRNGLDAKKRSGQSFGKGEYFAYNPIKCCRHCKGGNEMLVFLVVVPAEDETNAVVRQKAQMGYVVVENNAHQWPLGTVVFDTITDHRLLARSNRSRQLQAMRREKHIRATIEQHTKTHAEEERGKVCIIQAIIQDKWDLAERMWKELRFTNRGEWIAPTPSTKGMQAEISHFVHLKLDAQVAKVLFPNIPHPTY